MWVSGTASMLPTYHGVFFAMEAPYLKMCVIRGPLRSLIVVILRACRKACRRSVFQCNTKIDACTSKVPCFTIISGAQSTLLSVPELVTPCAVMWRHVSLSARMPGR